MICINSAIKNFDEIMTVYINNAFWCEKPIILCIGSDKATGDCLAPLVGTMLTEELGVDTHVFGTLRSPVHAKNVQQVYKDIKELYPHRKILCIDACMGTPAEVGFVKLTTGGLFAGAAAFKELGTYGDHSILAVVDEKSENKYDIFRTRMQRVYEMSRNISTALKCAIG